MYFILYVLCVSIDDEALFKRRQYIEDKYVYALLEGAVYYPQYKIMVYSSCLRIRIYLNAMLEWNTKSIKIHPPP